MPQTIREHDMIALLRDVPDQGLSAGEIGAVVYIHQNGAAYEVEFASARDKGMGGVVTVNAVDLLRLKDLDRYARS